MLRGVTMTIRPSEGIAIDEAEEIFIAAGDKAILVWNDDRGQWECFQSIAGRVYP